MCFTSCVLSTGCKDCENRAQGGHHAEGFGSETRLSHGRRVQTVGQARRHAGTQVITPHLSSGSGYNERSRFMLAVFKILSDKKLNWKLNSMKRIGSRPTDNFCISKTFDITFIFVLIYLLHWQWKEDVSHNHLY